jgi:hypothetical protein
MANRSNRGSDEAAVGSSATERVDLYGFPSADFIRASGHADRVKQVGYMSAPDRASRTSENPCIDGAASGPHRALPGSGPPPRHDREMSGAGVELWYHGGGRNIDQASRPALIG